MSVSETLTPSCYGSIGESCPGPPSTLPPEHLRGVEVRFEDRYGWVHLDTCGGCRLMMRACSKRYPSPCDSAAQAFLDQAAVVTARAQRAWAKQMREAKTPVSWQIIQSTTGDVYLEALKRLERYADENIGSERARFSSYWMRYLIKEVGTKYWQALRTDKPDDFLDDEDTLRSPTAKKLGAKPDNPTIDLSSASEIPGYISTARAWFDMQSDGDQQLLVAMLAHIVHTNKQPSNSQLYNALHGADTEARAGAQRLRRQRQALMTAFIDGLLTPALTIDATSREVIVRTIVHATPPLEDGRHPTPAAFLSALDTEVQLLIENIDHSQNPEDPS